jgi:hypothetical protein
MANQYTKVQLWLDTPNLNTDLHIKSQYTKVVMQILLEKLSDNPQLIDKILTLAKNEPNFERGAASE